AAELAEASKLAAALWARASAVERQAADAAKQQAFDRATALFTEAKRAYQQAAQSAAASGASSADRDRTAARKPERGEAEQARTAVAGARGEAERAAAARLAPQLFAAAQRKETEADGLLNRQDFASAKQRLREAQQSYKQAAQEAERIATAERQK